MDPYNKFMEPYNRYASGEYWNPPTQSNIQNNSRSGTFSRLTNIVLPSLRSLPFPERLEHPASRTNQAAIRANNEAGSAQHSQNRTEPNVTINVDYHPQVVIQTSPQEQYSLIRPRSKRGRKALDSSQFVCLVCFERETGQWRSGPWGGNTLCNGCGISYSKSIDKLEKKHIKHIPLQFYAKPEGVQNIKNRTLENSPYFLTDIKNYFDEKKFKELKSLAERYKSIKRSSWYPQTSKVEINANHINAYIQRAVNLCSLEEAANPSDEGGTKCLPVRIGKYNGTTHDDNIEELSKNLAKDAAAIEAYVHHFTWDRGLCSTQEKYDHNIRQLALLETSEEPQTKRRKFDMNDRLNPVPVEDDSLMLEDRIAPTEEPKGAQTQPRRDERLDIAFILNSPMDD